MSATYTSVIDIYTPLRFLVTVINYVAVKAVVYLYLMCIVHTTQLTFTGEYCFFSRTNVPLDSLSKLLNYFQTFAVRALFSVVTPSVDPVRLYRRAFLGCRPNSTCLISCGFVVDYFAVQFAVQQIIDN